jgi:pimeloyl-ACP methyl ester carboxylesterase
VSHLYRIVLAAVLTACAAATPPPGTSHPAVALRPAQVDTEAGEHVAYERGVLRVRENRAKPASAAIEIAFARIPGPPGATAPPIIFLPGGPGASYLDAFDDTTENSRRRLGMFRRYAAVADVIVMDTRGYSPTATVLREPVPAPIPLDAPNTVAATAAQWRAYARDLAAANPGRDLAGYHVAEVAADVEELRVALGYHQVTLLGGSFGSQTALAVMRLYPTSIARAVLSGVEPLDNGFDMPSHVYAALQRIAADADRASNLQPFLPPGGLLAAIDELLARFARGPITVTLHEPGGDVAITLGLEDLQGALLPRDGRDAAADWPAWILAIYHGSYDAWARAELESRRGPPVLAAVNPLIDSGLGVSAARARTLDADPAVRVLGRWNFALHQDTRASWPTPDLGDALRAFIPTAIPVVMIQGDWDTSTPVENARELAPYLTRSRLLIVHRGEHAQPSRLTREDPAAFDAILAFMRTGDLSAVPAEITLAAPAFTTPRVAPPRTR